MLDCGIGKSKVFVPDSYNFVFEVASNGVILPSISTFTVLCVTTESEDVVTFAKPSTSLIPKLRL